MNPTEPETTNWCIFLVRAANIDSPEKCPIHDPILQRYDIKNELYRALMLLAVL